MDGESTAAGTVGWRLIVREDGEWTGRCPAVETVSHWTSRRVDLRNPLPSGPFPTQLRPREGGHWPRATAIPQVRLFSEWQLPPGGGQAAVVAGGAEA